MVHEDDAPSVLPNSCMQMLLAMKFSPGTTGMEQHVAEKLDHFLLLEDLLAERMEWESTILPRAGSDHWPIPLHWHSRENSKGTPFHYDKMWLLDPHFKDLIKEWWNHAEVNTG